MTVHQMKCFLTLAEMLNFSRASEVLNMTQPALSKMIISIEDEVGTTLVQRTKRSVVLTDAGRVLCRHFEQILSQYQFGVDQARAAGHGQRGCVRLGFSSVVNSVILPELMGKLRRDFPDIDVALHDATQVELLQMLSGGDLDLIFADSFVLDSYPLLAYRTINTQELGVMLSREHPLAGRREIDLEELRGENLLISGRLGQVPSGPSTTNAVVTSVLYESGLISQVTQVTRTISNMIVMVDCGLGVAVLPRQMLGYAPASVQFVPLVRGVEREPLTLNVIAVWNPDRKNACVSTVLEVIDRILAEVE